MLQTDFDAPPRWVPDPKPDAKDAKNCEITPTHRCITAEHSALKIAPIDLPDSIFYCEVLSGVHQVGKA